MPLPARTQEIKFFDVAITNGTWPLVGSAAAAEPATAFAGITELNDILQGAGAYQRVGQKVVLKSFAFKCNLELGGTSCDGQRQDHDHLRQAA